MYDLLIGRCGFPRDDLIKKGGIIYHVVGGTAVNDELIGRGVAAWRDVAISCMYFTI